MPKIALLLLGLTLWFGVINAAEVTPQRQQQLKHLLKHDCGSCHGLSLKGGLGPALTANALSNKSNELLRHIILYGRSGTPMPPFSGLLSLDEVDWLIASMRNGSVSDE